MILRSLDVLESEVNAKLAEDNLNEALNYIKYFVDIILSQDYATANVFDSPVLDELCQEIGARTLKLNETPRLTSKKDHRLIIYIASALYLYGGHTAVIQDLITHQPEALHLILVTEYIPSSDHDKVRDRFAGLPVEIEWADEQDTFLNKLIWLQTQLLSLNPSKLFLFNHNNDPAPVAAIQPNLAPQIIFYHHGDHQLCLGVHLDYAIHIDPHSFGFLNCRNELGVANNRYWPLIATDLGKRSPHTPFMANGTLTTCTSGGAYKFAADYLYPYEEQIAKILAVTKGKHIHIGGLPDEKIQKIYSDLQRLGINEECFILIPWVSSLWQALIEQQVDLYITSFPIGGAKAAVEVMGSGTPLVVHENYQAPMLGTGFMAYEEAFVWRRPQELLDYLRNLTPEVLTQQSNLARNQYEHYHLPEVFKEQLCKLDRDDSQLLPSFYKQVKRDELQVSLDLYYKFERLKFQQPVLYAPKSKEPLEIELSYFSRIKNKLGSYRKKLNKVIA